MTQLDSGTEDLRTEIQRRVVGTREPRCDRAAAVARQMYDGVFDDQLCRRQLTLQQCADPETRRNFRQAPERRAVGQCHAHIVRAQIEAVGHRIEAEPDARDRYLEADAGALERGFDVGREPVERDRPLHETPDRDDDEQDQDCGEGAEPSRHMMRAAPEAPRRALVHDPARAPAVLTGFGRRASVAALAGIVRWQSY